MSLNLRLYHINSDHFNPLIPSHFHFSNSPVFFLLFLLILLLLLPLFLPFFTLFLSYFLLLFPSSRPPHYNNNIPATLCHVLHPISTQPHSWR